MMMVLDHKQQYLDGLRSALSILVFPIQYAANLPVSSGNWMGDNLISRETLLKQVENLGSQNTFLQAQMQKYVSLELENMRLRQLLDASERISERILATELYAVDLDPFNHKVLLDKGKRHHVYRNQPLLDSNGVYGQITRVTPLTSTAMLITDPSHAIPVQVARNGLRAIAAGNGSMSSLDLLHIPNNGDIKAGDLLVSSGLGGIFPAGYPVAVVESVQPDPSQPYAAVTATPKAALDRSRLVLLVWNQNTLKERAKEETLEGSETENTTEELRVSNGQ